LQGLAALLVLGLSGCTPGEILAVQPGFIEMLGLKQSLTPSRNNGFLNMFLKMQKLTLGLLVSGAVVWGGGGAGFGVMRVLIMIVLLGRGEALWPVSNRCPWLGWGFLWTLGVHLSVVCTALLARRNIWHVCLMMCVTAADRVLAAALLFWLCALLPGCAGLVWSFLLVMTESDKWQQLSCSGTQTWAEEAAAEPAGASAALCRCLYGSH
jgi:hypothetical protein